MLSRGSSARDNGRSLLDHLAALNACDLLDLMNTAVIASTDSNSPPADKPPWSRLLQKARLGRHFTEGARQLWLVVLGKNWSQRELARQVAEASGKKTKHNRSALMSRWLYGERKPTLHYVLILQELLNIDPALWEKPPVEPFTPPGAQEGQ